MQAGRHSNYRGEKEKAYTSCIKELEVQTFVIVISAFVVSEICSLEWHLKYGSSPPLYPPPFSAARTEGLLESETGTVVHRRVHNTDVSQVI